VADPATTPEPSRPQTLLDGAVDLYLLSKNKRAKDTQRKTRNLVARLRQFCSTYEPVITTVQECNDFEALTRFVASWTDANTTQNNNRTELIAFFSFCVKAKYITENAASGLATIPNTTPQTDVFTHEELIDIYVAASHLADEYGRGGTSIAKQTKAFALVLRYTGLSIGDVTGLPKSHVHGDRIVTNRDKTGKEVYVRVPSVVLEALRDAPHDSDQYFFWSGNGEIRTRTSKWGDRLQRLFVLARVRLKEVDHWPKRATKSRKARKNAETSKRTISQADPRWFRHTLARDLLENQIVTMEELSEILANSLAVCDKHYSKWDRRRQTRIDDKLEQFWGTDPILNRR
jgi:integrase